MGKRIKLFFTALVLASLYSAAAAAVTTIYATDDSMTQAMAPDQNNNGFPFLYIVDNGVSFYSFGFMKFSSAQIPAAINSAVLYLYYYSSSGDPVITLQPCASNWTETTITYNNMPVTTGPTALMTVLDATEGYYSVDITAIVNYWLGSGNYGLKISCLPGGSHGTQVHSSEAGPGFVPYLVINYGTITETPTLSPTCTVSPTCSETPTSSHSPVMSATVTETATILPTLNITPGTGMDWDLAVNPAAFSERYAHAGVVFQNKMWVIAGYSFSTFSTVNDVYSSTNGTDWTIVTGTAAFSPRGFSGCVVYDDKLWIIGGGSDTGVLNDVWSSADGINWVLVTPAAGFAPRSWHSTVVYDGRMWVIGGSDYNLAMNDVWSSYDGANWTLETGAAGFAGRYGHSCTVFNNLMWVINGNGISTGDYNDAWYSADGVIWTQATAAAPYTGRYSSSLQVYGGIMWMTAGYDNDTSLPLNDVWWSNNGSTWTQATAAADFSGRAGFSSYVFMDRMWLVGGYNGTIGLNDVWYSPPGPLSTATMTPTRTETLTHTITPTATPSTTGTPPTHTSTPTSTEVFTATVTGTPSSLTADGLWHEVADASSPPGRPFTSSSLNSWYYGQDITGNYNTGTPNSGSITIPGISVSTGQQLTFWSWLQTENGATPAPRVYDSAKVYAALSGSGAWDMVHEIGANEEVWEHVAVDLSLYYGQAVDIRFTFDTDDDYMNDYRGWYIDDIEVGYLATPTATITGTPPTSTATPTVTVTPTMIGTCACTDVFGNTEIGSVSMGIGSFGVVVSNPAVLSRDVFARGMNVSVSVAGGGRIRLAIYADNGSGGPGNLVVQSAPFAPSVTGWYNIAIPQTYLAVGTYWLAMQMENGVEVNFETGTNLEIFDNIAGFGDFAPVWLVQNPSSNAWSINIEYCPLVCASPTPTETITGTPPTQTETYTVTVTETPTLSMTGTPPTVTETSTETATFSITETPATQTETYTVTVTETPTLSMTGTPPTQTETYTVTVTETEALSMTTTPSLTETASATVTETEALSMTTTPSLTETASATVTETEALSMTTTPFLTETASATVTETADSSLTATPSMTETASATAVVPSQTNTATCTLSVTHTTTATPGLTATLTSSFTPVNSATATIAITATPTIAATETVFTINNQVLYPNPFTPGTAAQLRTAYYLSQNCGKIKMKVYTDAFRLVLDITLRQSDSGGAGTRVDTIPANTFDNFASGIYYYYIEAESAGGKKLRSKADYLIILR